MAIFIYENQEILIIISTSEFGGVAQNELVSANTFERVVNSRGVGGWRVAWQRAGEDEESA